jgi:hypothetical protein
MKKLSALIVIALASAASAGDVLKAQPGAWDPEETGIITAAWMPGTGLPDAGDSDHGLVLEKNGPTTANAAAVAVIRGGEGPFVALAFEVAGYCGAGAPRFNVTTADGVMHFVGCCYGEHVLNEATGFEHVRFTGEDAYPPIPAGAIVTRISIVFDEQGQTVLDDIAINGEIIGKPGNVR